MGKGKTDNQSSGLTKDSFVEVINSLKAQIERDIRYSEVLGGLLRVEGIPLYDSSALIHALSIALESSLGGASSDSFMEEINRFCYDLNFGSVEGSDIKTPEALWDKLSSQDRFRSNCTGVCGICDGCASDKEGEPNVKSIEELDSVLDKFFETLSKNRVEPVEDDEEEEYFSPVPKEVIQKMREVNEAILGLQEYVDLESIEVKDQHGVKVVSFQISEKEKDGNY